MRARQGRKLPGRAGSTLSPAHTIVLCSTPTIVQAKPGASAFTSNFLLFVGSHAGDCCLKHGSCYGGCRKETPAPQVCAQAIQQVPSTRAPAWRGRGLLRCKEACQIPDWVLGWLGMTAAVQRSCCHRSSMITTSACGSPRTSSWLVQLGWLLSRDCHNHGPYNVSYPDLQRIRLYRTGSQFTKLFPPPLAPALLLSKSRILSESPLFSCWAWPHAQSELSDCVACAGLHERDLGRRMETREVVMLVASQTAVLGLAQCCWSPRIWQRDPSLQKK